MVLLHLCVTRGRKDGSEREQYMKPDEVFGLQMATSASRESSQLRYGTVLKLNKGGIGGCNPGVVVPPESMDSLCDLPEGADCLSVRSYSEGNECCMARTLRTKSRLSRIIYQIHSLGANRVLPKARFVHDCWTMVVESIESGALHGKCESIISAKARKESPVRRLIPVGAC